MDTLNKIKMLVEKMSTDTYKVFDKGNHSASIRARKYAQEIKELVKPYRKEILDEIKIHDDQKRKLKLQKKPLQELSEDDFKFLKDCGSLLVFYPDAPEEFDDIKQ